MPLIDLENLRVIELAATDPILTTCYDPADGWTAVTFNNRGGPPIRSTHGGDKTILAALRNMLKYTSQEVDARVKYDVDKLELNRKDTWIGFKYTVSGTQLVAFRASTN